MTEPVEVRQLPPAMRAFSALVMIGVAVLSYYAAYSNPTRGHWVGDVMGALALWFALYTLRAPSLLVRADEAGITYADTRLGMFFVFGEGRAAWSDVVSVDTATRSTRSGSYLRTRVTVRGEGGSGTRSFTVTSRCAGYMAFLDALHAHTAATGAVMKGLGDDPARATQALGDMRRNRVVVLVAVWLALVCVALAVFLQRR